jgi:hypothetical protein
MGLGSYLSDRTQCVRPRFSSSVADLQRCYDEVNAYLKRIYDWDGSNSLKLNP